MSKSVSPIKFGWCTNYSNPSHNANTGIYIILKNPYGKSCHFFQYKNCVNVFVKYSKKGDIKIVQADLIKITVFLYNV